VRNDPSRAAVVIAKITLGVAEFARGVFFSGYRPVTVVRPVWFCASFRRGRRRLFAPNEPKSQVLLHRGMFCIVRAPVTS
jgi:hypothetical protein